MTKKKSTSRVYSFVNVGVEVCYTDFDGVLTIVPTSPMTAACYFTDGLPRECVLAFTSGDFKFWRAPRWTLINELSGADIESYIQRWLAGASVDSGDIQVRKR